MTAKTRSKGGRPAFVPTTTQRRRVEEMRTCGTSEDDIAIAIGISRITLRKHFVAQLTTGRARRRAEINQLLWREARAGKGWAIKELGRQASAAAAEADYLEDEKPDTKAPSGRQLGKKEEAQIAAQTVGLGSEWGDDLQVPSSRPN